MNFTLLVKKLLLWSVGIGFILYISLCFFVYLNQNKLLYLPSSNKDLEQFLDMSTSVISLSINTNEGITVGRGVGTGTCIVFYLGGNAENTDYQFVSERKWGGNCIFTSMNYRSFGPSQGTPNEENIHKDSLDFFDTVVNYYHPNSIFVVGRSLGTNPAIYVTKERMEKIKKLVLITPYDSMENVALFHYPFLPIKFMIHDTLYSDDIARWISIPTLIFQASGDTVIPAKSTENLISSFTKTRPEKVLIQGVDHDNITNDSFFLMKINEFLGE